MRLDIVGDSDDLTFRRVHGVPARVVVPFRRSPSPDSRNHPGRRPGSEVLPAGTVVKEGRMPLAADVLVARDVPMARRDGTVIYADVFRPPHGRPVPVILAWSPYDKASTTGLKNDVFANRMDVDVCWEDGLNTFETAPSSSLPPESSGQPSTTSSSRSTTYLRSRRRSWGPRTTSG
jgi:hypothetical protein